MPGTAGQTAADAVWQLLLELRRRCRTADPADVSMLSIGPDGVPATRSRPDRIAELRRIDADWRVEFCRGGASLLALYLPVCVASAARPLVVAHLGQSLDGHIATASGDSNFVTGPGNLDHLHRMRALADAVVVGAGTVEADDPRLTTRRVPGPSPVRVVIDPQRRLAPDHAVFTDAMAPTIVLCAAAGADACAKEVAPRMASKVGNGPLRTGVETIELPVTAAGLDLAAALAALRDRGIHSLFVEGGGRTVSAFLEAGLVDRLQVAVAPLVTGAGRRGLSLPARSAIAECLRPASRTFTMGADVLFDCDLRAGEDASAASAGAGEWPDTSESDYPDSLPRRVR